MKEVIFPGIGLNLNISDIAVNFFGLNIYWYGLIITFAIVLVMFFLYKDNNKYNIKFYEIWKIILIIIPISILSARIYYVLFKFEYYKNHVSQIVNIRNGGLAIYGGIIGAIITILIYCKKMNINLFDVLDYIAPFLPLGQAIGRWGNFINVEAHGIETSSILRMGIVEKGKYIEVHPTFLYESIGDFIIFLILYNLRKKRKYKGEITCLYFLFYSFLRFFVEGLRTDSLMLGNFRISQILSMILFIAFSLILLIKEKNNKENGFYDKKNG